MTVDDFWQLSDADRERYTAMLARHGFPPGSPVVWSEIVGRWFPRLRVAQRRRDAAGHLVLLDGDLIEDVTTVRYRRT